jgi:hypothetical protein
MFPYQTSSVPNLADVFALGLISSIEDIDPDLGNLIGLEY